MRDGERWSVTEPEPRTRDWKRRALTAERRIEVLTELIDTQWRLLDHERKIAQSSARGLFWSLITVTAALFVVLGLRAAGVM